MCINRKVLNAAKFVLSMEGQPGEITEPINYQGRYFILRRGEAIPKSFEDARKELEVSLRNRRAYAVTAELAQKVTETLKQNKNVEATAQHLPEQVRAERRGEYERDAAEFSIAAALRTRGYTVRQSGNTFSISR